MLTTKKNSAMKIGGMTVSSSRARPAGPVRRSITMSATKPAGRRRTDARWSCDGTVDVENGHRAPPLLVVVVVVDVVAGELEEDVVERRRAQREIAPGPTGVEGDGDGSDRRGAVGGADEELVATRVDALDAGDLDHRARAGGITVDAGDDDVVADAALELVGRALGHEPAVVDDADPVGELVGLLEVLRREEDRHLELAVEPANLFPHRGPAHRIEPGGRLVEEQDLGVVDQRGGQIEAALHATRVGRDATVERVADVDQPAQLDQAVVDLRLGQAVEPALEAQQLDPVCLGSRATSCSATPMRRRTFSGWVATS